MCILQFVKQVTIQKLKKFQDYEISVLGFTSKGDGPPSAGMVVRTLEDGTEKQSFCPCLSIHQSINERNKQRINQTNNQSIIQSINQLISQSSNHSINQSINQSINHSINQSIN